jgi:hypothetical protein
MAERVRGTSAERERLFARSERQRRKKKGDREALWPWRDCDEEGPVLDLLLDPIRPYQWFGYSETAAAFKAREDGWSEKILPSRMWTTR